MQCPKCSQVFPSDQLFKQHAIATHGAPASILSTQEMISVSHPAIAQEVQPVTPAVFDETPTYEPVSNPKDRPKFVVPLPHPVNNHIVTTHDVPEKTLPIELKYAFVGHCETCGNLVKTTMVDVKGEMFALALCPKCEEVCATRKVKPL